MKKICIIGNNRHGKDIADGGSIKVRLYKTFLERLGHETYIADLDGWIKRPLRLIKQIKYGVKNCDSIVIMGGPKGCRIAIPLVNKYNKKIKKRVVFCPLGIGTVDILIKNFNTEKVTNFIQSKDFYDLKDEKMKKQLEKIDLIIPQNQMLCELYNNFYGLNNISLLINFRDEKVINHVYSPTIPFKIIYISRLKKNKGILDIVRVANDLINEGYKIILDIYGQQELDGEDLNNFNNMLNAAVKYFGPAKHEEVSSIIAQHDLFVLPTAYYGEGTSGALIESMFAGTPALISSYSQAHLIIKDGVNGLIYKLGDNNDLAKKIIYAYENNEIMKNISVEAQKEALKYSFDANKEYFEECILGK